ncbi:MAG: trypsin-like serine peptidase [Parahaliea sp.]
MSHCHKIPSKDKQAAIRLSGIIIFITLCFWQTTSTQAAQAQNRIPPDSRKTYIEGQSPRWLGAIGQLVIPGIRYQNGYSQHHTEYCSATLINPKPAMASDIIITAWHCLEFYTDLSQTITFHLSTNKPAQVFEARRLQDGGGMDADWAILRLSRAVSISEAPALTPDSTTAETGVELVMAGYSRDAGLGQGGQRLTYDNNCQVTAMTAGNSDSNCLAYKGASGGAVVRYSNSGDALFTGVISEGNSSGLSRFVPLPVFKRQLQYYFQDF